jgi:hypothetical protein
MRGYHRWAMDPPASVDVPLQGVNVVHIELEDGATMSASTAEFEPTEHGLLIGLLLIPWHRVRRYSWSLAPRDFMADADGHARARVRLAVHGEDEIVVLAERFETGSWTVNVVVDEFMDAETGLVHRQRLFVPWHMVREYERMPLTLEAPPRPDA